MLSKEEKDRLITRFARQAGDTGSPEVQVALLTNRIQQLTEHLKTHKKDDAGRRGLLKLVGQRRKHLAYLSRTDPQKYAVITEQLGLRK